MGKCLVEDCKNPGANEVTGKVEGGSKKLYFCEKHFEAFSEMMIEARQAENN